MRALSLAALFALAPLASSQSALESIWVRQIVGGVAQGGFVAADGAGGVLLFGTDSGPFGSPPPAGDELFVARYRADGTPEWTRRFGSTGPERASAIAPDGTGGAFVAGSTQGSLAGPLGGLIDAYIARYDGNGNQVWLRQEGTVGADSFVGVASDGAGGCFALGQTDRGWAGPFLGGASDGVLMHYDAAGSLLSGVQFGTAGDEYVESIAPDGAGGAIVVGWALGGTFPGNPIGSGPSFVARFDSAGTLTSAVQFGSTSGQPTAAAADGSGGAFVTGITVTGTSSLSIDGYVLRIDAFGNVLWTRAIVTPGLFTIPYAMKRAPSGEPIAVGTAYDGFLVAGSPSVLVPTDGFVVRHDAAGALVSHDVVGGPDEDDFRSLALDGSAGVWLGGATTGAFGGPSHSGYQLFAARFGYAIGAAYCGPAVPNSTGSPGRIVAAGNEAASENALTLVADHMPTSTFGYFLASRTTGLTPTAGGSQGTLCLGGTIGRYNRASEIGATGMSGSFFLGLDLGSIPQPSGAVAALAGETWSFQAWYRDANPMTTSNFTDGVAVTLQ